MGARLSRTITKQNSSHGPDKSASKYVPVWIISEPEQSVSVLSKTPELNLVPTVTLESKWFMGRPEIYGPPTRAMGTTIRPVVPFGDREHQSEQLAQQLTNRHAATNSITESTVHQETSLPRLESEPLIYQLRLKLLEDSPTRLMLLELYNLDMHTLSEEEFIQWCYDSRMPQTMTMYKTFQQDATAYAMKRHLTALENRFDVQITLGDCKPLYGSGVPDTENQSFPQAQMVRELAVYGKTQSSIIAAVQYLGATLNQIRCNQLLLPSNHLFSLSSEMNLQKWIQPQLIDTNNRILIHLRKHSEQRGQK
ncbi:hypothetical protein FGIG_07016 [Fasciola gigantica]|uniref:Uncharacterized protein n=1 Tax=Fasciola gigantica TaxID=46835 RepID=A0A504YXS8_FASGI|nr:hypothetical protein FGIG_07016 [Fasciola gigantica]